MPGVASELLAQGREGRLLASVQLAVCRSRYVRSESQVVSFARELGVRPNHGAEARSAVQSAPGAGAVAALNAWPAGPITVLLGGGSTGVVR